MYGTRLIKRGLAVLAGLLILDFYNNYMQANRVDALCKFQGHHLVASSARIHLEARQWIVNPMLRSSKASAARDEYEMAAWPSAMFRIPTMKNV